MISVEIVDLVSPSGDYELVYFPLIFPLIPIITIRNTCCGLTEYLFIARIALLEWDIVLFSGTAINQRLMSDGNYMKRIYYTHIHL
jgi:hypothetical protein